MSDDVITRDENGDLAVRTVTATEGGTGSQYDDLYARTTDGKWANIYAHKINNGMDISLPATSGTMVVATPPTATGNYVLKAIVAEDGTMTTTWVTE